MATSLPTNELSSWALTVLMALTMDIIVANLYYL